MKKLLLVCCLLFVAMFVIGQELNCRVHVLAPTINNVNKRSLENLQNVIRDFLNNTKWTSETYLPQERIRCNLVLTIINYDGGSSYTAEAQIQSGRPVFGTSYSSTLLNMKDKDFEFGYSDGQSLDFSEQNFISNLSSLLGYYAYTIIGLDKDSFSKLGGAPYYVKAQNVLNVAQANGGKGWKAIDGLKNRYWLNENLLNNGFKELRTFIYNYHLNGLDRMQSDKSIGLKTILKFLDDLQQMNKQKLGSIFPNMYFTNKTEEITNIFALADIQDRIKAYNYLITIDPGNIGKYEVLRKK